MINRMISVLKKVNCQFLDVSSPPSYGVNISRLIRFTRVCSDADDLNNRSKFLTFRLLKQGYRCHKLHKAFPKFYYRYSELIIKYNICFKLFRNNAYHNLYLMVI